MVLQTPCLMSLVVFSAWPRTATLSVFQSQALSVSCSEFNNKHCTVRKYRTIKWVQVSLAEVSDFLTKAN